MLTDWETLRAVFARPRAMPAPPKAPAVDTLEAVVGPCPCDECPRRGPCATDLTACSAFLLYVDGASPIRWRLAPRQDTNAATFRRIYGD